MQIVCTTNFISFSSIVWSVTIGGSYSTIYSQNSFVSNPNGMYSISNTYDNSYGYTTSVLTVNNQGSSGNFIFQFNPYPGGSNSVEIDFIRQCL